MELGSEGFRLILELLTDSVPSSFDSLVLVCPVGQLCPNRLGKFSWCQAMGSAVGSPPKSSWSPKWPPPARWASSVPQMLRQSRWLVPRDGGWDTSASRGQQPGHGAYVARGRCGAVSGPSPHPHQYREHLIDAKLSGGQAWVLFNSCAVPSPQVGCSNTVWLGRCSAPSSLGPLHCPWNII